MPRLFPAFSDNSWGRPNPSDIIRAGYQGLFRYLGSDSVDYGVKTHGQGHDLSKAELKSYLDAGLLVAFVWERTENRVLGGRTVGMNDASAANGYMDDLGVPDSVPVIGVVVDFDATDAQIRGSIWDYANGFKKMSKRPVLPYGKYSVLEILCGELKLFPYGWQCAGWSGSGGGSGGSYPCSDGSHRRLSRYAFAFQDVGYVLNDTSDHNGLIMPNVVNQVAWNPSIKVEPETQEEDEVSSIIVHADTTKSKRLQMLLGKAGEPGGFVNVAFQCFSDWTMRRVFGDEIDKLKFYGIPEHPDFIQGDDGDANWWNLFSLRSRDWSDPLAKQDAVGE